MQQRPKWPAEPKVINIWLFTEKCAKLWSTNLLFVLLGQLTTNLPKTVWQALQGLALLGLLTLVSRFCQPNALCSILNLPYPFSFHVFENSFHLICMEFTFPSPTFSA